jgi:type II secretory pathway component GspD/PulD (secretin)
MAFKGTQARKMNLRGFRGLKVLSCAALLIGLAAMQTGVAAQQQLPASPASKAAAGSLRVRVKRNGAYFVSVRAKAVPLTEIAAELSRQLKAPVVLSRVMEKQKVTLEFQDLPLETALQLMAPLPYVHYELQGGSQPVCREIFLNAYNESAPVPKLENRNISFVMQGDTESLDSKDDPLQVDYRNGRLTVKVQKQSLAAVLDRIATVLSVNLIMKQETNDTVDLDFKEVSLEDAISYFPPSVHLHVRKDIQRVTTVPLLVEFAN